MKTFKLWFPLVLWMGLIFFFSSIPNLKSDLEYDFFLRKLAHITEYFILTLLAQRALKGTFHLNRFYLFVYPVLFSFLYAMSDEFHQTFVTGRHGCVQDVMIDGIGILGIKLLEFFI